MPINSKDIWPATRKGDNSGSHIDFDVTGSSFHLARQFWVEYYTCGYETVCAQEASLRQLNAAT
jgi:hypothetical protein